MAKWIVRGLIVLATAILAGIITLGSIAFHGVTVFDIVLRDRYIVVQTYQALLLLLAGEFVAIATAVYLRRHVA